MGKAFYRVGNSVKWGGFSSGTVGEKLFSHMGREGCYAMLGPFFQGGCLPRDRLFLGGGGGSILQRQQHVQSGVGSAKIATRIP